MFWNQRVGSFYHELHRGLGPECSTRRSNAHPYHRRRRGGGGTDFFTRVVCLGARPPVPFAVGYPRELQSIERLVQVLGTSGQHLLADAAFLGQVAALRAAVNALPGARDDRFTTWADMMRRAAYRTADEVIGNAAPCQQVIDFETHRTQTICE
jgi:hypothetical protein